jgi:hypothetical protein
LDSAGGGGSGSAARRATHLAVRLAQAVEDCLERLSHGVVRGAAGGLDLGEHADVERRRRALGGALHQRSQLALGGALHGRYFCAPRVRGG